MKPLASILVVDDEPTNFDVIETLLMAENYQLHYASNGQRALERLEGFNPDVILLDVMMPDLDGIEVCRRIRSMSAWASIPIVMVTALTSKGDLARAIAAGADDFMSKPVSSLELKSRIHSMLRIKRQQDQLKANVQQREQTITFLEGSLQTLRGNVIRALPHELNTPLHGMLGLVDLLIDSYSEMSAEEVQETLQYCKRSAVRMERLIQKFLSYVRLQLLASDANRIAKLRDTQHHMPAHMVIEQVAFDKATAFNRRADLQLNVSPALLNLSVSDLQLMLEELLDNAFKFSTLGSPVQVNGHPEGDQFAFVISNQGRSLMAEQVSQIGSLMQFERQQFEQQGVGLGLAIVQTILGIYGGTLSIQSEQEVGTTLDIRLPLSVEWQAPEMSLTLDE